MHGTSFEVWPKRLEAEKALATVEQGARLANRCGWDRQSEAAGTEAYQLRLDCGVMYQRSGHRRSAAAVGQFPMPDSGPSDVSQDRQVLEGASRAVCPPVAAKSVQSRLSALQQQPRLRPGQGLFLSFSATTASPAGDATGTLHDYYSSILRI